MLLLNIHIRHLNNGNALFTLIVTLLNFKWGFELFKTKILGFTILPRHTCLYRHWEKFVSHVNPILTKPSVYWFWEPSFETTSTSTRPTFNQIKLFTTYAPFRVRALSCFAIRFGLSRM